MMGEIGFVVVDDGVVGGDGGGSSRDGVVGEEVPWFMVMSMVAGRVMLSDLVLAGNLFHIKFEHSSLGGKNFKIEIGSSILAGRNSK
jgi:hypothetical protein